MDQNIYWFSFVMGLGSFAGLVLVARSIVRSTPDAILQLAIQIENALNLVDSQNKSAEKEREELLSILEGIEKNVRSLKYQHDHADKFEFGTGKVNIKVDDLSKEILMLRFKIEAYMDK